MPMFENIDFLPGDGDDDLEPTFELFQVFLRENGFALVEVNDVVHVSVLDAGKAFCGVPLVGSVSPGEESELCLECHDGLCLRFGFDPPEKEGS